MIKLHYAVLFLFFTCNFALAKEYYFRLLSGEIVLISTSDDTSLQEAINTGDFESSFIDSDDSDQIIETQVDSNNLLSEIISLHANSLSFQPNPAESGNVFELINICPAPVQSEMSYTYKCAIPNCMRKFKHRATSGSSKRSRHHRTHFKPEFLKSLKQQLVVCPFCNANVTGTLRAIMRHFAQVCPGNK